jgi:hypothetical protein
MDVVLDTTQSHDLLVKVDPATHCVHHGLGLLENLLLHEAEKNEKGFKIFVLGLGSRSISRL